MKNDKPQTKNYKRKWFFILFSVFIIPLIFILLMEFGLRITGYGYQTTATVKYSWKSKTAYCNNNKFSWRFFPKEIAREPDPYIFYPEKASYTYRIFIFGGSAAQGVPASEYNFGRILKVMLDKAYPDVNFEIINTSMTAINSHVVLEIVKDISQFESDMFIVYMGNNEVVGPYGAGTIFSSFSPNLSLLRAGSTLKTTKIGQLFTGLLKSLNKKKNSTKPWKGLEMFLDKQVRADDLNLQLVYKHFKKNLEDIINIAYKKNIKVVLSTVSSNLKDSPPFASQHRRDISAEDLSIWKKYYQKAIYLIEEAQYDSAIRLLKIANNIDNTYAKLHFRLGNCYWKVERYELAKQSYIKARELDTLRFRADSNINRIIRNIAKEKAGQNLIFNDSVKEFSKISQYQIPGEEYFHEHVHFNFNGNYLLARMMFENIEEKLPKWIKKKYSNNTRLSKQECEKALAYTKWDHFDIKSNVLYNYLKKAPYNNQLNHSLREVKIEEELKLLRTEITKEVMAISNNIYKNAINDAPDDWWLHYKYAEFLHAGFKYFNESAKYYQNIITLLPHVCHGYAGLGHMFLKQGQYEKAIELCNKALEINPLRVDIRNILGVAHYRAEYFKKAEEIYIECNKIRPYFLPAYLNYAILLQKLERIEDGIAICRKGLKYNPKSWKLHHKLGLFFKQQKNIDSSIKEFTIALKINPYSKKTREILNKLLKEKIK